MQDSRKKAVRFDRVSSKDQRDGFSLTAQKAAGEKYAKQHKLKVVKTWSVDESASKEADRKFFFQMIDYVKENDIQDIIFDKVDRACRGFNSAQVIEEVVEHNKVRFHFTRDHLVIDRDSPPQEKLRFYLGTILGKYYIDNLKTEIKKGLDARLERGYWNRKAPFGYKNTRVGPHKTAVLITEPETSEFVKEMFELYVTGNYSQGYFVKEIKSRFPHINTNGRLIETVLSNTIYHGIITERGKQYKGQHEPLISKKLFDDCQKIRSLRAKKQIVNQAQITAKPFMGFMKCGICDHAITGEVKKKPNGRIYIYYHCANKHCTAKRQNTSQKIIEEQIIQAFEPFKEFTYERCRAMIETIKDQLMDLSITPKRKPGNWLKNALKSRKTYPN